MLYTMIQPQSFLGTGEEDFSMFSPYMDMAANLFNSSTPSGQIVGTTSPEGPINLVKIGSGFREEKLFFKIYTILYMHKSLGQGQIPPGDNSLIVTDKFHYFNHTL